MRDTAGYKRIGRAATLHSELLELTMQCRQFDEALGSKTPELIARRRRIEDESAASQTDAGIAARWGQHPPRASGLPHTAPRSSDRIRVPRDHLSLEFSPVREETAAKKPRRVIQRRIRRLPLIFGEAPVTPTDPPSLSGPTEGVPRCQKKIAAEMCLLGLENGGCRFPSDTPAGLTRGQEGPFTDQPFELDSSGLPIQPPRTSGRSQGGSV